MVPLTLLALTMLIAIVPAQSMGGTIRYMLSGDSITEIVCWRSELWQHLQSTEWATVSFVRSSRTENYCRDSSFRPR
jgi:hypothetical protein